MSFKFGKRSLTRLEGIHADLRRVMDRAIAISPIDFTILEGMRTLDRQKKLLARGATTTLNSRHLTGHAVDLAPLVNGEVTWAWPVYHELAPHIKRAAQIEEVDLDWGGDWQRFPDGPHWELSWSAYPKK